MKFYTNVLMYLICKHNIIVVSKYTLYIYRIVLLFLNRCLSVYTKNH